MANGDLHLLGTLYMGGVKSLMPSNPVDPGNITAFSPGASIEIRDTDADNSYKLRWREVDVGGKKLLVSDRNILRNISWDDLNAQGLVAGKEITIDNQQYKIRLLTGGAERRERGEGVSYGGGITPNEWDDIVTNEGNYAGLPKPTATDLDATSNATDLNGIHNQIWHWYSIYSHTQEKYMHGVSLNSTRGNFSARRWEYASSVGRVSTLSWRPVLEVLWTPPKNSVKINGVWRDYQDGWVKIGGVWREIDEIHVKVNGVWRKSE